MARGRESEGATTSPRLLPASTYSTDPALRCALAGLLPPARLAGHDAELAVMGRAAAGELFAWAAQAEAEPPRLCAIDPWGRRVDEVVYGEAWRKIGGVAARSGLASLPHERPGPESRIVQAALCYLFGPSSATYNCPVAMTDAAAAVLSSAGPEFAAVVGRLLERDPERAWTAGQWMTEPQGGSDVGANSVEAHEAGGQWSLRGRKYFCSNLGGDCFLVLARPAGAGPGTAGLGLFLVERLLPDGSRNALRVDRLKDKLGTRAMATGEVTLEGARGLPVGPLGDGFKQMTTMLNVTRLHNAVAAAGLMRRGVTMAVEYGRWRTAFGQPLNRLPLHREVLADLAVEAEAALALVLRVAELLGRVEAGTATEGERALFRVGASLAKLCTGKQAVSVASEVIECFGGAGYVEDTGVPRLLRDAQVLPIWEGTTSVLALDVLRALGRPGVRDAVCGETGFDVAPLLGDERQARRTAMALARAWTGRLLEAAAGRGGDRAEAVARRWSGGGRADDLELLLEAA